jgi:NAD(P)-dependent dehydrogenase (short-subunit alcohol dehydrogenase family)
MRTRDQLVIGAAAGVALAWGAREVLRRSRRITLEGRVVVITGGSTGHGFIAARQAAEQGARLVIAARGVQELRAAEAELAQAGSGEVLAVPTDVADPAAARHLIERAIDRFGRVDVLVNNAGIIVVGPLSTMTRQDFEYAMAVNFWGALNCTLAVLPHMRAARFGRIANVGSVGGKAAMPHLAPYTVSKFALSGLTKALRSELVQDGILVTGIYPDTMRTGGHTHALFKGDRPAEYSWFGLTDTIPGIALSAEDVARRMWRGILDGDAEVSMGLASRVAAKLDALFPNPAVEALTLLNRSLPRAGGPNEALRGEDIHGRLPDYLNRAIPPNTRPGE